MAEQAFALSPIAASGTLPTDADYAAISEAFMETARGRWFLQEYARRNRQADTAMVLEAVSRVERALEAQKEPPRNDLPAIVAAMRTIVAAARSGAETALAQPAIEEALAPSRKCARIIKEIAWGLRESGADIRICNLLDMQVEAIGKACDEFSADGIRVGVMAAFDAAEQGIDGLERGETGDEPAPAANVVNIARAQPARVQPAEAVIEPVKSVEIVEAVLPPEAVAVEPLAAQEVATAESLPVPSIAMAEALPAPVEASATASSLGASLIANGVVKKPVLLRNDPLAPLRRMSSAERVAFFS